MNVNAFDEIEEWLQTVKFKKVKFGGVDEADVWRKIDELNSLYEKALISAMSEKTSESADNIGTPADGGQGGVL